MFHGCQQPPSQPWKVSPFLHIQERSFCLKSPGSSSSSSFIICQQPPWATALCEARGLYLSLHRRAAGRGAGQHRHMVPGLCLVHPGSWITLNSSNKMQPALPSLQASIVTNHFLGHHFFGCSEESRAFPRPRARDTIDEETQGLSPSTRVPRKETRGKLEGSPCLKRPFPSMLSTQAPS